MIAEPRKRIVFVLPNFGMIGAQRLTATTMRLLDRARFEPVGVVFDDRDQIRGEIPADTPVSVPGEHTSALPQLTKFVMTARINYGVTQSAVCPAAS